MRTLLIDDVRDILADRIARTFDDGIQALQEGPWDVLYLDHDLGDTDPQKSGTQIVNWLEEHPEHLPLKTVIVSSNPVGRKYMQTVLDRLYSRQSE